MIKNSKRKNINYSSIQDSFYELDFENQNEVKVTLKRKETIKNLKFGKIMKDLLNITSKKSSLEEIPTVLEANISEEDKINILSELYTFNHGNCGCGVWEYSCMLGDSQEKNSLEKLKQNLLFLGYRIEVINCHFIWYRTLAMQEKYEKRINSGKPLPSDISNFIISNYKGEKINLFENTYTLEYLATFGDKRAIETYNNFMVRVGGIRLDGTGKPFSKVK